jgi:CBS domain-containing protein
MSDFPLARILDFVRTVSPFDTLDPDELNTLVRRMDIAYFPPGSKVVEQGGDPARYLYIIHSGSVKLTSTEEDGHEILLDVRGEGDTFGALSLLHSEKGHFTVTAQEDLLAFVLPSQDFISMVEAHPGFQRHFKFSLAAHDQSIRSLTDGFLLQVGGADPWGDMALQMHNRISELMSAPVLTCPRNTTVRQAAQHMNQRKVGSIVVADDMGSPLGVVTDTDLRSRVLAQGLSAYTPVDLVMSSPVQTISPRAFAFEAMLEMTRQGVHHLVVADGARLLGMISDHDIKIITGSSPVGLVSQIDKVKNFPELARLPRRIYRVLNMLLRLGVSAEYMLDLLAEFSDRLTLRLIQITEQEMDAEGMGPAPAPFAWLALGAWGRREPTPPAGQEHVLVIDDMKQEQATQVLPWFQEMARRVKQGLAGCGFPPCRSGILADMPGGCRTLSQWQEQFASWIREPLAKDLETAAHFFDFRAITESGVFEDPLRNFVFKEIELHRFFLRLLARSGLDNQLPLGFMRQFVVEKTGEYTAELDLDAKVMQPVVQAARVLAFDQRVESTGTFDRLEEVTTRGLLHRELADDLHEAFGFLTLLRISRYLEARARDSQPDVTLDASSLNKLQRKMLKDTFSVVGDLQEIMIKRYGARPTGG